MLWCVYVQCQIRIRFLLCRRDRCCSGWESTVCIPAVVKKYACNSVNKLPSLYTVPFRRWCNPNFATPRRVMSVPFQTSVIYACFNHHTVVLLVVSWKGNVHCRHKCARRVEGMSGSRRYGTEDDRVNAVEIIRKDDVSRLLAHQSNRVKRINNAR